MISVRDFGDPVCFFLHTFCFLQSISCFYRSHSRSKGDVLLTCILGKSWRSIHILWDDQWPVSILTIAKDFWAWLAGLSLSSFSQCNIILVPQGYYMFHCFGWWSKHQLVTGLFLWCRYGGHPLQSLLGIMQNPLGCSQEVSTWLVTPICPYRIL